MGSRIMHIIIGNKIAESLKIEDKTTFLLGNIAPDAVFSHEEKTASHFYAGEIQDFTRKIDYNTFLHKYSNLTENPYILGYIAHLIADDIWLRGFNLSWLRNRMEADPDLYQLYHHDFRLLNGKLLREYGFTADLRKSLGRFSEMINLDEVKPDDVEKFVPYVLGDMEYTEEQLHEKLRVFTLDQIIGYVETSVNLGVFNVKRVLANQV
ncbi:zinc dependent phospholipase C family protein [Gracilibacillus caseinilyticus]|uniref:Zinc dependent phospholipase C family protein n=1 Tax=Gracilibacillus caseinilyticus TaxID=2932256 RepID=A0ABY4F2W6_9BACI|nr:zinc dependent phospholipase C family protein [Gracilibacillus caseinilyticus]UOQ50581.1 zinc dependent phospholipase C family protein [Gracilibacillus caseinilyticus]